MTFDSRDVPLKKEEKKHFQAIQNYLLKKNVL